MDRPPPYRKLATRLSLALLTLLGGIGALAWLAPGSLTKSGSVAVTSGPSAALYESVNNLAAATPGWAHTGAELASEGSVALLGFVLAWFLLANTRQRNWRLLAAGVLVGAGTAVAYAISEALKLAINEERPCTVITGATSLAECPTNGDWSFPSNHATIAAALAVGLALVWPLLRVLVLSLGAAAGALRVLVGVHYPHDVLAGMVLGGAVTVALLFLVPSRASAGEAPPLRRGKIC